MRHETIMNWAIVMSLAGACGLASATESVGTTAERVAGANSTRGTRQDPRQVARVMKRFSWEPSPVEVHRVAVRYHRLSGVALKRLARRIRARGALPELKLSLDRGRVDSAVARVEAGSPSRMTRQNGADMTWSVQARWALYRLIFDPNEIKVQNQRYRQAELRQELLAQVTRLYFLRRRIEVLSVLRPARNVKTAVYRRLRLDQLTAELDALTGGWFSRELARRRSKRKR
ncbi:MAG: hypothetical protein J7M25_02940 [Deltaproteobacteria bacterium]|nr:hypothetical protein [Deltaproteobacteria bacterium]